MNSLLNIPSLHMVLKCVICVKVRVENIVFVELEGKMFPNLLWYTL